jgi:multiple sugar transport system permease protein
LFLYVLLVAFVFVKVLGADVIGDSGVPKKKKKKGDAELPVPMTSLEMAGGAH